MGGAADYDHRATFHRMVPGQDAAGIEVRVASPIGGAWAKVLYGSGAERRTAAGTEAGQAFTVRVRSTAKMRSVTIADQVSVKNQLTGLELTGAITGLVPVGAGDIEFTAMAALGAGA